VKGAAGADSVEMLARPLHQLAEAAAAFEGGEEEAVIRHDDLLSGKPGSVDRAASISG
jgi:hypothetical protein